MSTPYIMPLGFIDRITEEGAVFQLTNPEDSNSLTSGTPVTVWRYSEDSLALGKLRGRITTFGYTTATFTTVETMTDPRWPENEEVLRARAPVFLAREESFEPDPSRAVSQERAEALRRMARRYGEISNRPESNTGENQS